jgi:cytochrome oxidase Cu insertion factor (SCO1/SenC/PrrC family)
VWIASFFFTTCPGVCIELNQYLAGLQRRLADHPATLVSITTDPKNDTPAVLKEYSQKLGADRDIWMFCTGDDSLIKRIGAEFFRAYATGGHHSTQLYVVDRWGNVRGDFDWRDPVGEVQMFELIDKLNAEATPPGEYSWISYTKPPELPDPDKRVKH